MMNIEIIRNKRIIGNKKGIGTIFILGLLLLLPLTLVNAGYVNPATVNLGTAGNFLVLAGTGITNDGMTDIYGDVGTSPTPAETGFPPGVIHGTDHAGDAVTQQAKLDLTTAYIDAAGRPKDLTVPTELGGTTLKHGVYDSAAGTFGITGTLTLDGESDPNAVFIFQAASTLITAANSEVKLINGAQAGNVFWQVGSSATIGASSKFVGNILALTSIDLDNDATVYGRLLARNGAVTLINDTIGQGFPLPVPESALGALTAVGACFAAFGILKMKRARNEKR